MKKNYLKPLCAVVPVKASRLLEGSLPKRGDITVTTDSNIGWAREQNDYPQSSSVWDD